MEKQFKRQNEVNFDVLKGKTFDKVYRDKFAEEDAIYFVGNQSFVLTHNQDCCEKVWIEDVCGDLNDLQNSEILQSEETEVELDYPKDSDMFETSYWYKFATIKGYVTIRFYGKTKSSYALDATLWEIVTNT